MHRSPELRAVLAFRLRSRTPEGWSRFYALWMAFNAIYGGEPDDRERARVMNAVRLHTPTREAKNLLRRHAASITMLIATPPGDLRRESWDPKFSAASKRCVRRYLDRNSSAQGRLSAVAGILYQVRCNLVHGSKDPDNKRDKMLVRESVKVLEDLLPSLESALTAPR